MPELPENTTPQNAKPLAVYIHWPFCKKKCPYCDFNSHVRAEVAETDWQQALLDELGYFAQRTRNREVVSMFFGGGTPSLMPPATVEALIDAVHQHWKVAPDLEITLEANPTSVEAQKLRAFKAAGVNRASLGVQSLNDAELQFLGREHSAKEALAAVEVAAGIFPRYSFDLIYARPNQKVAAWEMELKEALKFGSDHYSLYQLTIEPETAFHHAYHEKKAFALPPDDDAARMYELTQSMMEAAGLPAYEISNHAKPGSECRHNLAYWWGEEYVGVGPGAHGRLDLGGRLATLGLKSPERWLEKTLSDGNGMESETLLTQEQHIDERVMMGLRLTQGLSKQSFQTQTGVALDNAINQRQKAMLLQEGLLVEDEHYLRATPRGKLVLTSVITALVG